MEKLICYVFGLLIVLLYSIEFYKNARYPLLCNKKDDEFYIRSLEPLPAIKLTNCHYYFFSFFLFVIFSQIVFFSLTMTLKFFVPLIGFNDNLPQEALILASALLLIGFLPNMPFLQKMISKTREIFLKAAKVPIHECKIRTISKKLLNISFLKEIEYDTINSILSLRKNRFIHFSYAA